MTNDMKYAGSVRTEEDLKEVLGSFGGLWRYPDLLDYFFLVNPYFPTEAFLQRFKDKADLLICHYPSNRKVDSALAAAYFSVRPDSIVIGNGTSEIIKSVMEHTEGKIGVIRPTFEEYPNRYTPDDTVVMSVEDADFSYDEEDVIRFFTDHAVGTLVLINPDNPSGNWIGRNGLLKIASWAKERNIRVLLDESFSDFSSEEPSSLIEQEILDAFPNLFVIKSISKSYGVAGIRLGVAACGDTAYMDRLKKDLSIWNINSFAEFFFQIIRDDEEDYREALKHFREERAWFAEALSRIEGLRVLPSQANYLMVEVTGGMAVADLQKKLFTEYGILIKDLSSKIQSGRQFMRLAVRNREDNEFFVRKLKEALR